MGDFTGKVLLLLPSGIQQRPEWWVELSRLSGLDLRTAILEEAGSHRYDLELVRSI